MTSTVHWDLDMTALSSISHKDDGTNTTTALFRREPVIQPDGAEELVPIVSGNSFRGALRRIGEELMRDVLEYEGSLSLPAAHTLRSGGALRKVNGEPLSGSRLERLRSLIPQIAVFGGSTTGTMIKGRLQVGKVVPRVKETAHILTRPATFPLSGQFELMGIERYSRFDDSDSGDFPQPSGDNAKSTGHLMRYEIETLPAGTQFESWSRMTRATGDQIAFFTEVLKVFAESGRLGGRQAIGHGMIRLDSDQHVLGGAPVEDVDWRESLLRHKDEAVSALAEMQ